MKTLNLFVFLRFPPFEARESVMKLTGGNYPAPLKIIDVVKAGVHWWW